MNSAAASKPLLLRRRAAKQRLGAKLVTNTEAKVEHSMHAGVGSIQLAGKSSTQRMCHAKHADARGHFVCESLNQRTAPEQSDEHERSS